MAYRVANGGSAVVGTSQTFRRNADGSWTCVAPATIEHPKGRIQVSPGTTLKRGREFMGVDLAAWLDEHARDFLDPSRQ